MQWEKKLHWSSAFNGGVVNYKISHMHIIYTPCDEIVSIYDSKSVSSYIEYAGNNAHYIIYQVITSMKLSWINIMIEFAWPNLT